MNPSHEFQRAILTEALGELECRPRRRCLACGREVPAVLSQVSGDLNTESPWNRAAPPGMVRIFVYGLCGSCAFKVAHDPSLLTALLGRRLLRAEDQGDILCVWAHSAVLDAWPGPKATRLPLSEEGLTS